MKKATLRGALNTGLVCWQGVLRVGDLLSMRPSWVIHRNEHDQEYFILRYKGKTSHHSSKYHMSVIPKRHDRFDAFGIVKAALNMHGTKLMANVTTRQMLKLTKWASGPEVLNKPVTGHSFRVGGRNALAAAGADSSFLDLQGGWGRDSKAGFSEVYKRVQPQQVTWASAMGAE